MKVFRGLAELEAAVGSHLGYSPWLRITQEIVDRFAEVTGDHQWIHVDPQRASSGPFGGTIAHGFLTLSLVSRLSGEVYAIQGVAMEVNYGLNRVRFPAPVVVGASVRAGVEVVALDVGSSGHRLVTKVTVEQSENAKPACVGEMLSLIIE